MTKKTRLIILLCCVVCFFVIAPVLVYYSMGYRFDFEKMKIVETGGIYVRTFPAADKITIDGNISQKPGFLANSVFVQSLLPKNHTIYITKSGYYDYSKTLPVQEKEVTKLENVLLIKNNIQFEIITPTEKNPSPFDKKTTPTFKNSIASYTAGNATIWLSADGFLYQSDSTTPTASPTKITLVALKINKYASYQIISDGQNTFLLNNTNLLFLNKKTGGFEDFYSPVAGAKISPDGKNIIYFNNNYIYISPLPNLPAKKNTLYKSTEKISNVLWLNNDYIIFTSGNKIIISEIDFRGNINSVTLPQTATKIYFDQTSQKLYVLSEKTLMLSDRITP